MINKKKVTDNALLVRYIKNILVELNEDCDDNWWETDEALTGLGNLLNSDTYTCNNEDLNINSSKKIVFIKGDINSIETDINRQAKIEKDIAVCILITNELQYKYALEDKYKSQRKIKYFCTFINNSKYDEIKIDNVKRFEVLQFPSPKYEKYNPSKKSTDAHCSPIGYVYTVRLKSIVNIYNQLGDEIFEKNVRVGIGDANGVDKEIVNTLQDCPEMFWFRNNGITMLIEDKHFSLDRVGELLIRKKGNPRNFSIINGAQTINVASKYYYKKERELKESTDTNKEDNLQKFYKQFDSICILLRLIVIVDETSNESVNISVAQNRQKPIQIEDLAYTTEYVSKLYDYLKCKKNVEIVRRGEEDLVDSSITLIEFARAQKACALKPGEARSKSMNTLLGMYYDAKKRSNNALLFKDKDIFNEEWNEVTQDNEDSLYSKYYGATLFAIKLANKYYQIAKEIKCDNSKIDTILKNGKSYFVSSIVAILNNWSIDYTNFFYNKMIDNDILLKLITKFATELSDQIKDGINSNDFKKNDIFDDIIKGKNTMRTFTMMVQKVFNDKLYFGNNSNTYNQGAG